MTAGEYGTLTHYLKGKDLRHKGHTLECWYNSIIPSPIVYKTDKIESIEAKWNIIITERIEGKKKPEEFDKW